MKNKWMSLNPQENSEIQLIPEWQLSKPINNTAITEFWIWAITLLIVSDRKPKPKQMIKQNVPVNVQAAHVCTRCWFNMKTRCELRCNQSKINAHSLLSRLWSRTSFHPSSHSARGLPGAGLAGEQRDRDRDRTERGRRACSHCSLLPYPGPTLPQHTCVLYFPSMFYRLLQNSQHWAGGVGCVGCPSNSGFLSHCTCLRSSGVWHSLSFFNTFNLPSIINILACMWG